MAQIDAAVKMAHSIEKQFNSQDLKLAKAQGYSMDQLIRGAWLGGVGGVRKVLKGQGNPLIVNGTKIIKVEQLNKQCKNDKVN
jgi:hypothetical protein